MVRADTLDAIDTILRHFRGQPLLPFGGIQMLYIGDLFQLPPVVVGRRNGTCCSTIIPAHSFLMPR